MTLPFDWIFFDCFNTLIDDFDQEGDESGLGPMQLLPVQAGLYDNIYEFRADYLNWRSLELTPQSKEMPIHERLSALLSQRSPQMPAAELAELVEAMVTCFKQNYPSTLRLPLGVTEMLQSWYGKVSMGVVSNFHIGDWPEQLLKDFGLGQYLDFVVDSAQCGHRKPGPEIYILAAHQANIPESNYSRILFVGDHLLNDCLTPQRMGMQSVYFDRSRERQKSVQVPAHVSSIDELLTPSSCPG